jgi:hypothetical protein
MMRRIVGLMVAVALVSAAWGCRSQVNSLEGSVSSRYDLSFETTRVRLYDSALSIEYVREDGQVPVRVTLTRRESSTIGSGSYNLVERGDVRGRVDETRLPPLVSGSLELEMPNREDGSRVQGSFDVRLQAEDTTLTLRGKFTSDLERIDESRGYRFDAGGDAGDVGVDIGADVDGAVEVTRDGG